jgi:hypothetical protein
MAELYLIAAGYFLKFSNDPQVLQQKYLADNE